MGTKSTWKVRRCGYLVSYLAVEKGTCSFKHLNVTNFFMCYPFKHKTYIRSIKSTCVKAPTGVTMAIADEKNGSTNKYTGRTQKDTTSRMNTLLSVSLIFVLTLEAALPTTATVDVEVTDNEHSLRKNGRRLQFEWLGGYQPRSLITDHAAIDLDQKVIETLLGLRQLNLAKTIYEEGGHSQAIARIISNQPPEPPAQPVPRGTPVVGTSDEGKVIHGSLSEDLMWDTDNKFVELLVQYTANTDQTNYVGCQVGGLTVASMAYKDGCKLKIRLLVPGSSWCCHAQFLSLWILRF